MEKRGRARSARPLGAIATETKGRTDDRQIIRCTTFVADQNQRKEQAGRMRAMWLAAALALMAATTYVLTGQHLLATGMTAADPGTEAIPYVAARGYLLGGLLY